MFYTTASIECHDGRKSTLGRTGRQLPISASELNGGKMDGKPTEPATGSVQRAKHSPFQLHLVKQEAPANAIEAISDVYLD